MSLSSPGIGSGLDVQGIVQKLMAVEQQPLSKISARVVELKSQVSAYGSLKGAVSSFRDSLEKLSDIKKFKAFSATSSDTAVLAGTASTEAARGTYSLEVLRLAESHRMAAGTAFTGSADVVGSPGDRMQITVGGNSFGIDYGGKSLATTRDEINAASDNTGVTASLIRDDVGYRLTLASNGVGSSSFIQLEYTNAGTNIADPFALQSLNTDRDASGAFAAADLNAAVRLEGQYLVTSTSNTLSDAVQGVTLSLKKAGTATVTVDRDTAAVQSSVQAFAKSYSDLVALMTKMRREVLKSDTSALGTMESQMRAVLNSRVEGLGSLTNAFEAGLSTQKNGSLSVDTAMLSKIVAEDFDGLAKLFADPAQGLAKRLYDLADSYLETGGVLDGRSVGLERQVRESENKKTSVQERLKIVEARLLKTYNNLDLVVNRLQGTNSALTSQLEAITGFYRINNR
jgi:flagellar hook-associated protein 2